MIFELDGIAIEITRKRIKNLNIRIYPGGQVRVSAPLRSSKRFIEDTLLQKKGWIQTQQRLQRQQQNNTLPLETGSTVRYQGHSYLLIVELHNGPKHIQLEDNLLYCYTTSLNEVENTLDHWYKQQMTSLLPALIFHWEAQIGVKISEFKIRKMKSRWGSCHLQKASITLNSNLMKKPPICLEYVLVHELIHLLEPRHNARFYQFMSQFMPLWREYDALLEDKVPC